MSLLICLGTTFTQIQVCISSCFVPCDEFLFILDVLILFKSLCTQHRLSSVTNVLSLLNKQIK